MPEGAEVDLDRLHEAVQEEVEREGGAFLTRIALTTAILAAFAAVASLQAGATVNEALVLKTEATRLQAEASDQWAFYQAKGIKGAVQQAAREAWLAAGRDAPPLLAQEAGRYAREQDEIKAAAQEKEHARDAKSAEADALLTHHHRFANAVAMLQIAIALGAVAALTRKRLVWFGSVLVGVGGVALFLSQMM